MRKGNIFIKKNIDLMETNMKNFALSYNRHLITDWFTHRLDGWLIVA